MASNKNALPAGRSLILILLASGALYVGIEAIASESFTTPSRHGDGIRVDGVDATLIGVGWIFLAMGLFYRVFAQIFKIPGPIIGTVGFSLVGAFFWALVVL